MKAAAMAGQGAAPGPAAGGVGPGGSALMELEALLQRFRAAVSAGGGEGAPAARKQLLGALLRELEGRGNAERHPVMKLMAGPSVADAPRVVAELAGGVLQVCLDDQSSEGQLQQALALATCFFRISYRKCREAGHDPGEWLGAWEACMRFLGVAQGLASKPQGTSIVRMHAVQMLETAVLALSEDSPKDAPWPPVETRASMMQAATAALSSLLSLLRAPAVTTLPSQVAITLINSLTGMARTRPVFYGRILPVLLTLSPDCSLMAGGTPQGPRRRPLHSVVHCLKCGLLSLLKCIHASCLPWRDRLVAALQEMKAGDALASVLRQSDRAMRAAATKRKSHEGGGGEEDVKPPAHKASKKAKVAKGASLADLGEGPSAGGAPGGAAPVADPSTLFGEESGLSPLERMVGMLSALVAQGEAALKHVHTLVDNLPPEMLADVVIAYMEHLPDQLPAASAAAAPGVTGAAGAPGGAPEVKRDPRRDPRRQDPRRAAKEKGKVGGKGGEGEGAGAGEGMEVDYGRTLGVPMAQQPVRTSTVLVVVGDTKEELQVVHTPVALAPLAPEEVGEAMDMALERVASALEGAEQVGHAQLWVALLTRMMEESVRREEHEGAAGSAEEGAQEQPPGARGTPPGDLEGSLGFLLQQALQNYGPNQVGQDLALAVLFSLWKHGRGSAGPGGRGGAEKGGGRQVPKGKGKAKAEKANDRADAVPNGAGAEDGCPAAYRKFLLALLMRILYPTQQQGPKEQSGNSAAPDAPPSGAAAGSGGPGAPPAGTLKGKVLPLLLSAPCVPQAALDLLCRSCGLAEDRASPGAPGAPGEPAAAAGTGSAPGAAAAAPAAGGAAAGGAAAQGAGAGAGAPGAAKGGAQGAREDPEGDKLLTEGLAVLWRVLRLRPPLRTTCLDLILQCCTHRQSKVRRKAIPLVVNHLLSLPYAAPRIEDYAVEHLLAGGAVRAPGTVPGPGEGKDGKGGVEDASKKAEAQEALMHEAERLIGLFSALCSKRFGLLPMLFSAFGQAAMPAKRVILRDLLPSILACVPWTAPELLALLNSPPPGSLKLVLKALHLLLDSPRAAAAKPPPELLEVAKKVARTHPTEPDLAIPVLPYLTKEEAIQLLPRLLDLASDKFKLACNRLLQGSTHNKTPALTPLELIIALHAIQPKRDNVSIDKLMAAFTFCISQKSVFTHQVLATALNQLVEQTPLPFFLFRTMMQAVASFKDLAPFVVELLSRLLQKQVWKAQPQLWLGFVKCCGATKPTSFGVLLKLPAAQLEDALAKEPTLKEPLAAHAMQPDILPSVPQALRILLGIAAEPQGAPAAAEVPTPMEAS